MKSLLSVFIALLSFTIYAQDKDVFDVARYGTVEEMQRLESIDNDTINKINNSGFSTLILACYKGNTTVAEYLIKHVDNIDYLSNSGTALAATVFRGDVVLTKKLLESNANPNLVSFDGKTPLIYAVQLQNLELIKVLMEYNANKSIKDNNGKTAFEYAISTNNQKIINYLKSN